MNFLRIKLPLLLAALAVAACMGCSFSKQDGWKFAKWDKPRPFWKKGEKPDPEIPVRMVATWTDTVLRKAGETPKRGFGGRIIFFSKKSEDPVRVDGQFVVYAFDETDRPSYETQPSRTYVFPAEQFALHESENKLGPSYSVWLPWDELGGVQRKISLIARFEPKGGPMLLSEQTRHMLPGEAPGLRSLLADASGGDARYAAPTPGVQLAGYNSASGPSPVAGGPPASATAGAGVQPDSAAPQGLVETMTIPLPRALNARPEATPPQSQPGASAPNERAGASAPPAAADATTPASAATAPAAENPPTLSLRDSLLSTLPARGVPASRPVRGRAH